MPLDFNTLSKFLVDARARGELTSEEIDKIALSIGSELLKAASLEDIQNDFGGDDAMDNVIDHAVHVGMAQLREISPKLWRSIVTQDRPSPGGWEI